MTTTIEAVFDGKVLRLDQPLPFAPNTRVRITIEAVEPAPPDVTSFLRTARSLDLNAPADFATNVDLYLYGETHDVAT
ncbi:MAG TPA: antitoxin family protein [Roseiflexaceae bacterium]|nr:antitoxin family protein [Roseiflexaceae bacterium]